jgi:hypothetical protein
VSLLDPPATSPNSETGPCISPDSRQVPSESGTNGEDIYSYLFAVGATQHTAVDGGAFTRLGMRVVGAHGVHLDVSAARAQEALVDVRPVAPHLVVTWVELRRAVVHLACVFLRESAASLGLVNIQGGSKLLCNTKIEGGRDARNSPFMPPPTECG